MVKIKTDTQKRLIFWLNPKELKHLIKGGEVCIESIKQTPLQSDTIQEISFIVDTKL